MTVLVDDAAPPRTGARRALFGAFVVYLAWLPLPFGSNRPLLWAVNALAAAGLLASAALVSRSEGRAAAWTALPARMFIAAGAVIAWMLVQALAPVGPDLAHPVWATAATALGEPISGRLSATPWATLLSALRFATAVAVVGVAMELSREPRGAGRLLAAIVAIVAVYAAYGVGVQASGTRTILWVKKWAYEESLTSTFVNRNSAAPFLAIGLIGAVALVGSRLAGEGDGGRLQRAGWPAAAGLLILFALVLTGSRAGFLMAVLAALAVLGLLARQARRRTRWLAAGAGLLLLAAAAGVAVGGGHLLQRLLGSTPGEQARPSLYAITADLIEQRPLLGHGAGSFPGVFTGERPRWHQVFIVWMQSHDIYLELASDLGLPTAMLVVALVLDLLRIPIVEIRRRGDRAIQAILVAGVWLMLALHGVVDFPLQVQAIALYAAALLGVGAASASGKGSGPS